MVSTEQIKNALVDREIELKEKFENENIIERELHKLVQNFPTSGTALVITGVRRCGKSILAYMLAKDKNWAYVNFDDERLAISSNDLNKIIESIYSLKENVDVLVFDEIQNIIGWEKFVSRLMDNNKIIITGSNARLLSKELATHMTGRHIDLTLFPFSFKEFLNFKKITYNINSTKNISKIKNNLSEYLNVGGFPLSLKLGRLFLLELYKDVIERDILQRYKIRYPIVIRELSKYLITNIANELSFNSLRNILNLKSSHTIKKYATYLENSYLFFFVERFSYKLKEQMLAPKKVYCIDVALASACGFQFSQNLGRALENIVFIDLLRKSGFKKNYEIYYWKDHTQREVDFVVKQGNRVTSLIQVTAVSSKEEIKERELDSIIKASKSLNCTKLILITLDFEDILEIEDKKIIYIPIWKWLLTNQNFSK